MSAMAVEPPAVVRRDTPRPRLPSLLKLKRAHSNSWGETQPDRKRQFFGDIPYDDIIAGVIAGLGPPIYVCQDSRKAVYEHAFMGRTYDGTLDHKMKLVISAQLYTNHLARTFSLKFQVHDHRGPLKIWPLMEAEGVPLREEIKCGWTVANLRVELGRIIRPWLDFANRHFSHAQTAGPLAPGQVA